MKSLRFFVVLCGANYVSHHRMQDIDFEKILEFARLGIRRASLFMGLAINMANNPNVRDYDLSHQTKYRVLPKTNDEKVIEEYKHEFRTWVIANALRELHESFVEYLENVHQACLTFERAVGEKTPEDCDRLQKKFHNAGFPDKFDILRHQFTVTTQHVDGWLSVNAVRNCLTHRRSIVRREDFNEGDRLQLQWRALEIYFIPAEGVPVLNHDIPLRACSRSFLLKRKCRDEKQLRQRHQQREVRRNPASAAAACADAPSPRR